MYFSTVITNLALGLNFLCLGATRRKSLDKSGESLNNSFVRFLVIAPFGTTVLVTTPFGVTGGDQGVVVMSLALLVSLLSGVILLSHYYIHRGELNCDFLAWRRSSETLCTHRQGIN